VGARLPAGAARLTRPPLPVNSPLDVGPAGRRAGRRLLADLRAGRAFLASELSQPGWIDFGAFRWRDIDLRRAARAAFGVITPLAIGVATGHIAFGSFAALGALPAGFISFRGITRTRVLAVLLAAAGMAISTFVGATAEASHPLLLVPVIFAWAYLAGLLAALGPTALAVSLQWPVALLIASALPLAPGQAAVRALLVLAGGLWQGVLVVSSWALDRGGAERAAMSQSLLALSRYAASLAAGSHLPPPPTTMAGRQALRDPNPLMRSAARLQLLELTEEADRIRASLTAVGLDRTADGHQAAGHDLLLSASRVLEELGEALTGRSPRRPQHLAAAKRLLAATSAEVGARWQWAGEALLGQLRAACRIIEAGSDAEPATAGKPRPLTPWRQPPARELILTLRASIGTSTEAGRHALRLAVVTALAEVIVRAAGLPHGYWGVLTIFIVLRPDYSSTVYRGLQRAAGTVAGAGLGVLTVLLGHFGIAVLLVGIAVSLLAAYAVFTVHYLLYAVFLTDFVVVLLALLGLPPGPTALARLAGTGIGTGLALLAYVLWPTWEGTSASEKFARLFGLQGSYAAALLRAYTRPDDGSVARRAELQRAARRARIDADASADRLADEPDHPPMTGQLARALIAVGHRIAQACIALNAALAVHQASRSARIDDIGLQPQLDELAAGVAAATRQLARAVRGLASTGDQVGTVPLPPLRSQQQVIALAARGADSGAGSSAPGLPAGAVGPAASADGAPINPGAGDAGLVAATDGLVDAINTAAHILRYPGRVP
jgi:uncharacterized membrane protein YccC